MAIMDFPRLDDIIDYLLTHNSQPIPLKKISNIFSVSERTIRNDINIINDELSPFKSQIILHRGKGYNFSFSDDFLVWWEKEKNTNYETSLETPQERQDYLMILFFTAKDYLDLEYILNSIYISKNTFYNYLKNIRTLLEEYHLKILNRPNLGFILIGSEFNKRQALIELLIKKDLEKYILNFSDLECKLFKNIDLDKLQNIEFNTLKSLNLFESDYYHKNLISILALSISRIQQDFILDSIPLKAPIPKNQTKVVFDQLILKLEKQFDICFNTIEKEYLYYHLLINFPRLSIIDSQENSEIAKLSYDFILAFLHEIKNNSSFDWTQDKILIDDLVSHINNFLGLELYSKNRQNPLIDTIKRSFPLAYDISLINLEKLENKFGIYFSDDEIGYITLHIAGAIERNTSQLNSKLDTIIVCGSGLTMSKIIELKINKKYSELINVVGTYSFIEFNNINHDIDIDLIITTVPIAYNNIPIHTIDMNNLDRDLDNLNATISNYTNNNEYTKKLFSPQFFYIFNDNDNKNTILNFMTEQLINKNIVTTKFKDSVLLRESIASTCIGNNIAIPHPMELSAKKSILSVGIIPNGIIWNSTEKINFIFLFAISKEDYKNTQQIYNVLLNFMDNTNGQQDILSNPEFFKFLNILYT